MGEIGFQNCKFLVGDNDDTIRAVSSPIFRFDPGKGPCISCYCSESARTSYSFCAPGRLLSETFTRSSEVSTVQIVGTVQIVEAIGDLPAIARIRPFGITVLRILYPSQTGRELL